MFTIAHELQFLLYTMLQLIIKVLLKIRPTTNYSPSLTYKRFTFWKFHNASSNLESMSGFSNYLLNQLSSCNNNFTCNGNEGWKGIRQRRMLAGRWRERYWQILGDNGKKLTSPKYHDSHPCLLGNASPTKGHHLWTEPQPGGLPTLLSSSNTDGITCMSCCLPSLPFSPGEHGHMRFTSRPHSTPTTREAQ